MVRATILPKLLNPMNKKTALLILVILTASFWTKVKAGVSLMDIDLELEVSVDNNFPSVGEVLTFTIEVTNQGLGDATGIVVSASLPSGFTYVSANGNYSPTTGMWNISTLTAGQTVALDIIATINPSGYYLFLAEVTAVNEIDIDSTPGNGVDIDGDGISCNDFGDEDDGDGEFCTPPGVAELAIDIHADATIGIPGEEYTFTITIENQGPFTAYDIIVKDDLPSAYTLVEASDNSYNENTGLWLIDSIAIGQIDTLELLVSFNNQGVHQNYYRNSVVIISSATVDANTNNSASWTITPFNSIDLELGTYVDNPFPHIGDTLTFFVEVNNNGPTNATGIAIEANSYSARFDTIFNISDGGIQNNNGLVVWENLSIDSASSMNLSYEAIVGNTDNNYWEFNIYSEVVEAAQYDLDSSPDNDDGDQAEDDEYLTVFTPQNPDLQLVKKVNNTTPNVGEVITFSIEVTNTGVDTATNVLLEDYLPNGYSNITNISNEGVLSNDVISWPGFTVAQGDTVVLTFDAIVEAPLVGVEFQNIAEIVATDQADVDSTPGNGADTDGDGKIGPLDNDGSRDFDDEDDGDDEIVMPRQTDLELVKTVSDATPNVGDFVTFTIKLTNNGPDTATNIIFEDYLPNGYSNISNISNGGMLQNDIIRWEDFRLSVGSSASVTFDAVVEAPGPGISHLNTAQIVSTTEFDHDSTPNNDDGDQSEDDEDNEGVIPQQLDLELIQTIDNIAPDIGEEVTFTITITNNGPNDATNVAFQTLLASGYELVNFSDGGTLDGNKIEWSGFNIVAGGSTSVSYTLGVLLHINYENIAEVTYVDQFDPDSTPNNDDGDQSEDDEYALNITPPNCIGILLENVNCDNNGTNANSEDDTYTFSLHIANGPGNNWINNYGESDVYDVIYDYGPFPIANGPQNFVFIDLDSIACNYSIEIQPPTTCSTDDCDMVATYTFTPPSCYGSNDGIVQLMVEGGVPNYDTYYWNGSEYEEFEFGFNYGQDSLIFYIEDAFGCILRDTVAAPVPAPLEVNINPILQPDCADQEGGILLAEVSGDAPPFSYSWNTGSTSVVLTNLTPDIYALTVTDANDCIATNSIQLSPELNADAGPDHILPCTPDTSIRIGEYYEIPISFSNVPIEIQVKDVPGTAPPPQVIDGNIGIGFTPDTTEWDTNIDGTSLILASTQTWPGDTIWIPIQVYGFEDIVSFSFTIDHEESFMNTLSTVYTNSEVSGFNTANINFSGAPDFVTVSWEHPDEGLGASLQDGDTLLMLAYVIEDDLFFSNSYGTGVQYNWTGPNNFNATELAPLVDEPGTYYLNITSENIPDCMATDSVLVSQTTPSIQLEQTLITCDSVLLSNSVMNEEDMEFLWVYPNGSTSDQDSIGSKQNGYHHLTISGVESGCIVQDSILISLELDSCVLLEGRLVHDISEDCIPNMDEPGLANWLISIQSPGNTFYAVTQAGGYYKQYLPTGTYEVVPLLSNALWELCDDSYAQVMEEPGEVYLLDMPIQQAEPCPELSVALSIPLLRRCTTRTILINYENAGTEKALDAQVTITLDEQFIYLSASLPLIDQQANAYTFEIGDIEINETGQFSVQVYVPCDTPIGSTLCTEAIISPNETCESIDPLWSGASVAVEGRCEDDRVVFKVKNEGTANMIQSSPCIIVEDGVMFRVYPDSLRLEANEEYEYALPARGTTYRFEIEQVINHPGMSHPVAVVEGCGLNYQGVFSTGFVNQLFMDDDDEFVDIECREVVASFDPNDKHGFPRGYGAEHLIRSNQSIEYLINFQNTGNDTAFTVTIRDTLSMYLDITTVRPGAASHNYTWDIDDNNILVFTFENILLPDSTTNYSASRGFIEFKISPYDGLPYDLFDIIIENQAAIYFDSNPPVLTNITNHKLGEDFIEWSIASSHSELPNASIIVAPNPAQRIAEFLLDEWPAGIKHFELYDSQGRPVHQQEFIGKKYQLYCEHLPKGLYFFKIIDKKAGQGSGQLVVF